MNIVLVSTFDGGGGAAIATYRLFKGLQRLGANATMLVCEKMSDEPAILPPETSSEKLWVKIAAGLDKLPRTLLKTTNSSLITPAWLGSRMAARIRALKPDVLNIHWIGNGCLRPETLGALGDIPMLWTLHDMWAFCGGEHYTADWNERYKYGYTAQNRPPIESGFDLNKWVWRRKRKAYARIQHLRIAADSDWLAACARESALLGSRTVETVHYGLDTERFRPLDKRAAREILGVPHDKTLILFGAINATADERKGFDLLADGLRKYAQQYQNTSHQTQTKQAQCIVFGSSAPKHPPDVGLPVQYLGALRDELSLSVVYSAADVMIVPSREEAFGQTALEALSCGTPVVAFRVGGLPDSIEHKKNGYLAEPFETDDLARGIAFVVEDELRHRELSEAGRAKALQGFTLEHQARRYREIFAEMLRSKV
jgi:glycosyltransferase involved in cell wall biosynthesis